jgi:hypothetical protein
MVLWLAASVSEALISRLAVSAGPSIVLLIVGCNTPCSQSCDARFHFFLAHQSCQESAGNPWWRPHMTLWLLLRLLFREPSCETVSAAYT